MLSKAVNVAAQGLVASMLLSTAAIAESPAGVVFVLTDDTGYGDVDALYPSSLNTPHLDSLYNESVRLTDFHVGLVCAPSRAMPIQADAYVTDFWFNSAMDFITDSVEENEPFFAYVPLNAAHAPMNAPNGYRQGFDGMIENIDDNLGRSLICPAEPVTSASIPMF